MVPQSSLAVAAGAAASTALIVGVAAAVAATIASTPAVATSATLWSPSSCCLWAPSLRRSQGPHPFESGIVAEELGVNIDCRQVHQLGYKWPYPLPSISHKRQLMLPPAFVLRSRQTVRARRTFHDRRPAQSRAVAVQEISGMADRRDWGGGGNNPEESTQRMIERILESLTDIQARMDQQASVPPVAVPPGDGEAIPVALVPPRVEVPFAAPVPPPPPVLIAEEPVMQVEKFLRLQPPTYSGGPNPDTAEHWVHEIERVFTTMRSPAADRVVLAAYQLRGFAL
ncbi:hypothetical protein Taro_032678 [Colocasia esculenta]|uniref:Uncharacterized protein n=1 Tax=Colocasia esculenta TaxID=4460 RepID=A0A843VZP8_COLES|nr:hypothetical protein [Colocasia esculenta]